jgi:hypothetical protein
LNTVAWAPLLALARQPVRLLTLPSKARQDISLAGLELRRLVLWRLRFPVKRLGLPQSGPPQASPSLLRQMPLVRLPQAIRCPILELDLVEHPKKTQGLPLSLVP